MKFIVVDYKTSKRMAASDLCVLVQDNWDDYGYKTSFGLLYFNGEGERHDIGPIKILKRGMTGGYVQIPTEFSALSDDYCSIGQNQEYYESILEINEEYRIAILNGLRDLIWDEDRFHSFSEQDGLKTSLLRSVAETSIRKFRDVLNDQAKLTPYHFLYQFPGEGAASMEFRVNPGANPPTNIHVIIGRNGVGKTRLLTNLSEILRKGDATPNSVGRVKFITEDGDQHSSPPDAFANLITVAFSAFDDFSPPPQTGSKSGLVYSYIGLRRPRPPKGPPLPPKNPNDLCSEFVTSTLLCLRSSRKLRWRSAMEALETDPVFASIQMTKLAEIGDDTFEQAATELFSNCSSGHKIVLLIVTRLVELVSERTLILIDEPEAHLHPPLAASLIRALSELLASRNGVAILATHSPVILQEVPCDCVWLLFRENDLVDVERPQLETFAENFGMLTREVFRLEVTNSGYHSRIRAVTEEAQTLEDVILAFGGHLGAEGRAIARALLRNE